jgi:hypothetical protein
VRLTRTPPANAGRDARFLVSTIFMVDTIFGADHNQFKTVLPGLPGRLRTFRLTERFIGVGNFHEEKILAYSRASPANRLARHE